MICHYLRKSRSHYPVKLQLVFSHHEFPVVAASTPKICWKWLAPERAKSPTPQYKSTRTCSASRHSAALSTVPPLELPDAVPDAFPDASPMHRPPLVSPPQQLTTRAWSCAAHIQLFHRLLFSHVSPTVLRTILYCFTCFTCFFVLLF